jgi:poly-gamma-glutamate capsule biosynthesis protein CapA/YwtB (metallophosphatase superfamily)
VTLFLSGDVMTGRGIDQVLPHPSNPALYEGYVDSALDYVALAEKANGRITRPVDFSYIWGDSLEQLEQFAPDLRIVNLETSITTSEFYQPKGINYRMHPANTPCLTAARLDCCVLANNHVLDWGSRGLLETLNTLHTAGLQTAGAGRDLREALQPAVHQTGTARLLIFAAATLDSGVPPQWAATDTKPGVALLPALSAETAKSFAAHVHAIRQAGDIVVISIHWGGNWGYEVPRAQRDFAHRLIDLGAADVIHGHSSHHPKPIEVYSQKPILYGCGDFLNDYEGISGFEEYRGNHVLMYFVTLEPPTAKLRNLAMVPLELKQFRLRRSGVQDARWFSETLNREGKWAGTEILPGPRDTLMLQW